MEPAAKPSRVRADLTFNIYPAVVEGISGAVTMGWRKAYKHRDDEPNDRTREVVCSTIEEYVLNWFCETFSWPDRGTE